MTLRQETTQTVSVASRYSIPPAELEKGCSKFERYEGRDSVYRVATFLLEQWWGRPAEMADALIVMLLAWNAPFYKYGLFDQNHLEKFLFGHWDVISNLRDRDVMSLADADRAVIRRLFTGLHRALQFREGKGQGQKSPIAVAKTLHLLAPRFFPLWDYEIANYYGCGYSDNPAEAYLQLCCTFKQIAVTLASVIPPTSKSLLKQIDEYNYVTYTKGRI
jgi:hypothetical protein